MICIQSHFQDSWNAHSQLNVFDVTEALPLIETLPPSQQVKYPHSWSHKHQLKTYVYIFWPYIQVDLLWHAIISSKLAISHWKMMCGTAVCSQIRISRGPASSYSTLHTWHSHDSCIRAQAAHLMRGIRQTQLYSSHSCHLLIRGTAPHRWATQGSNVTEFHNHQLIWCWIKCQSAQLKSYQSQVYKN